MSIIDTLITDRTGGPYGVTDLNRVGQAVNYVAELLISAGYSVPVNPKTDWSTLDVPCESSMARYLQDIETIRSILAVLESTPETPPDMDSLTVQEANDIEKILVDVHFLTDNFLHTVDLGWALGIAHIGLYGGIV